MDRRGFLARLTAAAAGMAAAAQSGGLITAVSAATAPAGAVRRRRLSDVQEQLIDCLRECRVVGIEQQMTWNGPTHWKITYRQGRGGDLKSGDKPLPYCNLSHHQILDTGAPVSITATYQAETIDVSHLGEYKFDKVEPVLEVEVVWLLP